MCNFPETDRKNTKQFRFSVKKNQLFCGKTNYLQIEDRIAKSVHMKDVSFELLSMTNIVTASQFDLN